MQNRVACVMRYFGCGIDNVMELERRRSLKGQSDEKIKYPLRVYIHPSKSNFSSVCYFKV